MSNAALYMHANAFQSADARLLGRHSAGESFLRGLLRHAAVERHWFYNPSPLAERPDALDDLIVRLGPARRPVTWINGSQRAALAQVGLLHLPIPDVPAEAWLRRGHGAHSYAISGITHTTASAAVMRILGDMFVAPVEDYDALICTSAAVRDAVETQLDMIRDYMTEAYGPRRRGEAQRVTIPLGVNVSDFATSPADRKAWRERLEIPEDGVVALYVGRFNVRAKMNPALMAMALERAAQRTQRRIFWVNAGWAESETAELEYHTESAKLCPSVRYLHVDGRKPDVRFSIWSVGDLFISLSDNIQETFGLTPVEAMAAGLPSVVSDWNGYKDTVREGVDGFRIATLAPRPGLGGDLAYWFANGWISYDNYVGATAQYVAVDLDAAERALVDLIEHPDLRRRMGEAAQARAREVFDWSAIVPQYQALWAEQAARRRVAVSQAPLPNPLQPDPYVLFAGYPTRNLAKDDQVELVPGVTRETALTKLAGLLAGYSRLNRMTEKDVAQIVASLCERPTQAVAALLELFPPARRNFVERSLVWLARHDIIAIRKGG
jgi:glycosyltransferase involved in cell wall biosynthesis